MPKLKISEFSGEVPRRSDTQLKPNEAVAADNVRLYAGELQAWRGPEEEFTPVTTSAQTIYLFRNPSTEASQWLTWASDVDAQRSSLNDDSDFRLYYTGDGTPKKTNWAMQDTGGGGAYPETYYEMGVPAPTTAPTVAATTGTSVAADTRYYVYTFVSTFGSLQEESAPSPVSDAVTITSSQSVNISGMDSPPAGDYNITHIRIYRTVPGEATIGAYVFVAEEALTGGGAFDPSTDTHNDDLEADELGEAITTVGWTEPPDDLAGLTSMANGMMAGFVGNSVYFCEPYFHHAWPAEYTQSIPDQIVGLAAYGNTLVVMTTGQPWAMVGVSPDALTVEKIPMPQPCISKKSIAVDQYGVLYASPNGLVSIGPTGRGVITNDLFRRKEWQEYAPDTMVGAIYDGKYFATYESAVQGSKTMVISRDDIPALSFLSTRAEAFFSDVQNGDLHYLDSIEDKIYKLDSEPTNPYVYEWTSKRFFMDHGFTWSVIKLDFDIVQLSTNADYEDLIAEIEAENAAITGDIFSEVNGHYVNEYEIHGSILQAIPTAAAQVYCNIIFIGEDDEILSSISINSLNTRRIPPFRSRSLKIKLTGTANIRSIALATDMNALREYAQ